jgi:hypothetical protein
MQRSAEYKRTVSGRRWTAANQAPRGTGRHRCCLAFRVVRSAHDFDTSVGLRSIKSDAELPVCPWTLGGNRRCSDRYCWRRHDGRHRRCLAKGTRRVPARKDQSAAACESSDCANHAARLATPSDPLLAGRIDAESRGDQWDSVEGDDGDAHIRRSAQIGVAGLGVARRRPRGRRLHVRNSKTDAGVRYVDLLPVLRDELGALKASRDEAGEFVFPSAAGTRQDRNRVRPVGVTWHWPQGREPGPESRRTQKRRLAGCSLSGVNRIEQVTSCLQSARGNGPLGSFASVCGQIGLAASALRISQGRLRAAAASMGASIPSNQARAGPCFEIGPRRPESPDWITLGHRPV